MYLPNEERFALLRAQWILWVLLLLCASWSASAWALRVEEAEALRMFKGKSLVLRHSEPVERVTLADPAIADFILISPREIYITGKAVGATNLILWKGKESYRIYNLEVLFDVSQLKKQLHEIMPEETELCVTATNNSVTLSGQVSNAMNLSRVLTLARAYAPKDENNNKGKINNLMEVRGVQQVMLEVRIAEMQRSLGRELGINFDYLSGSGNIGMSRTGGLVQLEESDEGSFDRSVSSAVNILFQFASNGTNWTAYVDALRSEGLVNVLAEPTLIALSGESANFLAGGEFPVPVPSSGSNSYSIKYKEFGVGLTFTPTVLSGNKISLNVTPVVSEIDYSTTVQIGGYVVPGLSTRRAQTVVELADGQSFAIAGLMKDTYRDMLDKVPVLGDIPVLGALFRSREFQKNETELVIIVTPHLVKPLDMAKQSLPTDYYTEPNDLDFYILGRMQGRDTGPSEGMTGELDGDFGYALPGRE